jgi:dihydroorotate dehydrogenase
VAVNISSPNTKNLRELQRDDALDALLGSLKAAQARLADRHGKYVPLALKVAPDLEDAQIQAIAALLRQHRMDGVIATNTTLRASRRRGLPNAEQAGGLSGAPVLALSTAVIGKLAAALAAKCRSSASAGS